MEDIRVKLENKKQEIIDLIFIIADNGFYDGLLKKKDKLEKEIKYLEEQIVLEENDL